MKYKYQFSSLLSSRYPALVALASCTIRDLILGEELFYIVTTTILQLALVLKKKFGDVIMFKKESARMKYLGLFASATLKASSFCNNYYHCGGHKKLAPENTSISYQIEFNLPSQMYQQS